MGYDVLAAIGVVIASTAGHDGGGKGGDGDGDDTGDLHFECCVDFEQVVSGCKGWNWNLER